MQPGGKRWRRSLVSRARPEREKNVRMNERLRQREMTDDARATWDEDKKRRKGHSDGNRVVEKKVESPPDGSGIRGWTRGEREREISYE